MTFRCKLSIVDGARYVRISRTALGSRLPPFVAVQTRTAKLVKGTATIRLRLSPVEARRVRRARARGVAMGVRARALNGAKKVLLSQTKRTRVRR